ncbi:hypothetical protein COU58_03930 [Candidatus Pacearchaeota archaeon CG10_big_fil_rev_8_21_14_0_10_32_42]|nr:MAG: hypothetical protein COU58_03930 [Candidatus Pacearchaeota archaeon CG10_big_fil_rev_8_21_14_0_10_32_42]
MEKSIVDLLEGEKAIVLKCNCEKLLQHGFVPGTYIKIYKKISGVTSVFLRGAIIACRDEDYKNITIINSREIFENYVLSTKK